MKFCLLFLLISFSFSVNAQEYKSGADNNVTMTGDELAVKATIEKFLIAAGNYDVAVLRSLFLPNANIGAHRLTDGKWIPFSITAEAWFDSLSKNLNPKRYTEPVSNYTIHISEGRLAFVKADAILHRDGQSQSHNMDFFILMKDNDQWKFLSGSYTSVPIK